MPIPKDLSGDNAYRHAEVWRGQLGVSGGPRIGAAPRSIRKEFVTFIEIFEQTAHDSGLHALAKQRGITPRRAHKGQVSPANAGNDRLAYYGVHGQEAAAMVSEYITARWTATVNAQGNCFVRGAKTTLTSQSERRRVGNVDYSYEITMWFDNETIYVAFHCYENRN